MFSPVTAVAEQPRDASPLPGGTPWRRRVALVVVGVLTGVAFGCALIRYPGSQGDFAVYRAGARLVLDGGDLYSSPVWTDLKFTYPPFAAVVLAPFALLSYAAGSWLFTALSLVALGIAVTVVCAALRPPGPVLVWVGLAVPVAVLLLEPVRTTFGYGQINLLLLALVAVDCLARRPRWPRGALVGVAAAIKLTPLAFVLFFLLRRDRRAALVSVAAFACCTALGCLVTPANSLRYWTSAVFDTSRIGRLDYIGNESLRGVLAKAGIVAPAAQSLLWTVGCLVVVVVAAIGMRRALSRGNPDEALVLNALAALLVSPISWSHHWVWLVPTVLVHTVLAVRTRRRRYAWLAGAGGAVLLAGSVDTALLLGVYCWFALAVLVTAAATSRRRGAGICYHRRENSSEFDPGQSDRFGELIRMTWQRPGRSQCGKKQTSQSTNSHMASAVNSSQVGSS